MRVAALLLASLSMLVLTGCSKMSGEGDIKSSKYSSFQEASQWGAFKSGWLPQALPRSATNIVEVHNVDSNELWVTFRYPKNDIDGLIKECVLDQKARLPNAERTKRSAPWWPLELVDGSDEQSRKRWTILSCPSMRHAESVFAANIAVDRTSWTAWYWLVK